MSNRYALVIANEDYGKNATSLRGACRDAVHIANLLENIGFNVTSGNENMSRTKMSLVIDEFMNKLEEGDLFVFYYSGHGIQDMLKDNYLMPVDAQLYREQDISTECYSVSNIIQKNAETRSRGILLIDACRDHPTNGTEQYQRTKAATFLKSGLASTEHKPLNDIVISYATEPGGFAIDGDEETLSPYTSALIEHLPTPDKSIDEVLTNVRQQVISKTDRRQRPHYDNKLLGSTIYLVKTGKKKTDGQQPEPPIEPRKPQTGETETGWRRFSWLPKISIDIKILIGTMSVLMIVPAIYYGSNKLNSTNPTPPIVSPAPNNSGDPQAPTEPTEYKTGWVAVGFLKDPPSNHNFNFSGELTELKIGSEICAKSDVNVRSSAADWGTPKDILKPGKCATITNARRLQAGADQQLWAEIKYR